MVYALTYLIVMIPTYLWRYAFGASVISAAGESEVAELSGAMNICFLINYAILIFLAYRRSKKVNKSILPLFPVIAAIFDIVLVFIPFVPTVFNLMALIMGAQDQKDKVVYVIQKEEK